MTVVASRRTPLLLEAIRELAEYQNEDPVAVGFNVGNSFHACAQEWNASPPSSPVEVLDYYRRSGAMPAHLVFAAYGIPTEIELRKRICETVPKGATVLDFGAGIGAQLLPLTTCTCTHVDVAGKTMDYAKWRYEWRGRKVETIALEDDYMMRSPVAGRTFDAVICTEVIEHVPDPVAFVRLISGAVRTGGLCVATTSFHDHDGLHPMHLNVGVYDDDGFVSVFRENGLRPTERAHFFKKE